MKGEDTVEAIGWGLIFPHEENNKEEQEEGEREYWLKAGGGGDGGEKYSRKKDGVETLVVSCLPSASKTLTFVQTLFFKNLF